MGPPVVTFLGSGDAFGSGGRFQTCILVESGGTRFLIDCGASSLVAMKARGVNPATVSDVLISHLHGDHFAGLPFLILDAQVSKRTERLRISGPPGIEGRVRESMEMLFPQSSRTQQRFPLEFWELPVGCATELGPIRVTPIEVVHFCGAPPYALRVEFAGRTIAYSGDTEWTDALLEAARDTDLFIAEAYFFEKKVRFHLDYATLASQKARLGCRRLIVTHMSPDMLARLDTLDIEAAHDGKRIEL